MKRKLKSVIRAAAIQASRVVDLPLFPFTVLAASWFGWVRFVGVSHMRWSKKAFNSVGVFPIRDHYYEPLFNPSRLRHSLDEPRSLPGIDFNVAQQLSMLEEFHFNEELRAIPADAPSGDRAFYFHNGVYESGDAEYLYNLIRLLKPRRLIEVGSGMSTLLAAKALQRNKEERAGYLCEHVCIEPFEHAWLEESGVKIVRKKVEDVDVSLFQSMEANDILFIDSSHMIRPQGDVVCEYLQILPLIPKGVYVHIHDIFSPRDYPSSWVVDEVKFWNEQYLLEAFLTFNRDFQIVGALNFLKHNHFAELAKCCPILESDGATREPGAFWMVRV